MAWASTARARSTGCAAGAEKASGPRPGLAGWRTRRARPSAVSLVSTPLRWPRSASSSTSMTGTSALPRERGGKLQPVVHGCFQAGQPDPQRIGDRVGGARRG
jgi:hypothetical protein